MRAKLILGALLLLPLMAQGKVTKKPTAPELMAEARAAFYAYNPTVALQKLAAVRQLKKGFDADSVAALEQKVNRMDEMMQRVEDIQVIDSLTVNRDDFFRHYRLSASAGTLESPESMGIEENTVVYLPQDGTRMVWGTDRGLVGAQRLTDGTWEDPEPLGEVLNQGGTANYPYLLSDGTTLYYATDGEDSLGGLDLYMTREDRDGFAVPQNMGMPYNSPYDDYMLAIDEETGAGWFASDRNRLGDLVTIYVFIPSQVRVNLDVDSPDLAARARISVLSDADHSALLQTIADINPSSANYDDEAEFTFVMPDGTIYSRWEDFRKPEARRLMETYVDALADFETDEYRLRDMRRNYDGTNSEAILTLERKLKASRGTLRRLANQIITTEYGTR